MPNEMFPQNCMTSSASILSQEVIKLLGLRRAFETCKKIERPPDTFKLSSLLVKEQRYDSLARMLQWSTKVLSKAGESRNATVWPPLLTSFNLKGLSLLQRQIHS